jgi:hypothetical protein
MKTKPAETAEGLRRADNDARRVHWSRWPVLSESVGPVRRISADGAAWILFPTTTRARALPAGTRRSGRTPTATAVCFSALWNGRTRS